MPNISVKVDGIWLYAVKLFVDNQNTDGKFKMKVLFVLNKEFEYTDSNGDDATGWPWTLIDFVFEDVVKAYKSGGSD